MLTFLLILLLFSNALASRRDKSILFSRIVIMSFFFASFLAYNNLHIKALENGIGIFGGLFGITTITQSFNIFILLVAGAILSLNAFFPRKVYSSNINGKLFTSLIYNKNIISNKTAKQFSILEYSLIIVFIIYGAIFLMSSADIISVFLSIELQSYGLYILSTIYRDSESATASGLTYFLLGGLSSCFILLGSSLLYLNTGTTNLDNIYVLISIYEINDIPNLIYLFQPHYFHISLIIMAVGFLFKVSAAPFHFWSPDVYDGIPTIVTTFVAIIAKISIFIFFLELVYYTQHSHFYWNNIFILSSLFSLIVGSVLGLTQSRIKRLFAYSTISHVGFILLALSVNTMESIQAYIFYILQYTISNLNAFIILITMGFSLYLYTYKQGKDNNKTELIDSDNSPIQLISQIKGYFYINPYIAISLAITLFSFVGIPPIIGFFSKQMVLSAALDNGYVFMSLVAILTSVIGAGYYLNLIKEIFFYNNDYEINSANDKVEITGYVYSNNETMKKVDLTFNNIVISGSLSFTISTITLLLLLFIYIPQEWFDIVSIISLVLFNN